MPSEVRAEAQQGLWTPPTIKKMAALEIRV
jgi:hypothetical protein